MTKDEIMDHCLSYPMSYEDHPFGEGWVAMRHQGNKKIFALIFHHDNHLCVNLKCEPNRADFLRGLFEEVKPGYHMNKEHWNTLILDGNLPEQEIHDMVKHSFELTKPKSKKRQIIEG
ncbi:MmcQ/YjbR family DNA-binding protein [Brevibacillus ruminantium]|uniref:MmcQ/YjbR family DNA-binding protein n=1 Tax=Brevibacillus ruminantium TaxID=2950604 RepID=A0ABY4WG36_9BACL|nr:MmcQ/YjbR family DNA-binding protein [Brevibacillus ruminantium]USG66125.1 MmcQ/YjbR family DNA-binding protein [Brevibacillus ruminantium]